MATPIETVPFDILVGIAEMCTWGVEKLDDHRPSTYARYHSALARTSKHFHDLLNRALYIRNLKKDPPVNSCVLWAARIGNLGTIKRAHEYGADLDATGAREDADYDADWLSLPGRISYFASPLHLSIKHDHPGIVEYLLANRVNVHAQARDFCGCSDTPFFGRCYPLHVALEHCDETVCADYAGMLVRHGAHKVAVDIPAHSDLASAGRLDLVTVILERNDPFSLTSALHYAVSRQDLDLVNQILARDGVNAGANNWKLYSPLHVAISTPPAKLSIIDRILERPEVDASDAAPGWETPLHIAAWKGRSDIASVLLNRDDVNPLAKTVVGFNALHLAAQSGSKNVVEILLGLPGFPAGDVDYAGLSALHHACRADETEGLKGVLDQLINHPDIELDLLSTQGTPLHMAVRNRKFITAAALVRAGSNINPPSPVHMSNAQPSLLHECLLEYSQTQTDLVRELIAHGADINQVTPCHGKESTPLFFAASFASNVEAVQVLLDAGADINCLVRDLWVPFESCMTLVTAILEMFFDRFHPGSLRVEALGPLSDCVQLLLEHGAALGLPSFPSEDNFHSALHCAMQMTAAGYMYVLDLLLKHAQPRNITEDYLDNFIAGQVDMTRQGLIPRRALEHLIDFRLRIFPRNRSRSWNASSLADFILVNSMYMP